MPSVFTSNVYIEDDLTVDDVARVVSWRPLYFLEYSRPAMRWCNVDATLTNSTWELPFTGVTSSETNFTAQPCSKSQSGYFVWTCSFGFVQKGNNVFLSEELSSVLLAHLALLFGIPIILMLAIEVFFQVKKRRTASLDTHPLLSDATSDDQA
ncbi:hypothetical protein ACOME3_006438 [Neoechinorhynchus agilis]